MHTIKVSSITLSRLITDLHANTSYDTGFFIFSEKFINGSSIMPQKRNPVVLEHLRGRLQALISKASIPDDIVSGTPYGDINDVDALCCFRGGE